MFDEIVTNSTRRGFLTSTAAAGAMAALATLPTWVEGQAPAQGQGIDSNTGWLRGITAKNKQFFETGKMENAIPFLHIVNYFGAWRATAGVAQNDVTAVMNVKDPSGQPYKTNPYITPRNGELFASDASTPAALQKLGARIILCNNAFGFWTMLLGKATNQEPAAVRAEMLGNLAPGVTIVPAMVQAVEQAQR